MRRRLLASSLVALALALVGPGAAAEQLTQLTAAELATKLEQARGQVVLVNFWATWCRPCLDEIPLLMELADQYGARGFRLVPVSLDDAESLETQVRPFMNKWFPDFESYISVEYTMDDMVSAVDQNWNEVLPTSYLLDADGTVSEVLQGKYTQAEFAERVQRLLPEHVSRAD